MESTLIDIIGKIISIDLNISLLEYSFITTNKSNNVGVLA